MGYIIPQEWIDGCRMTLFRPSTEAWTCIKPHSLVCLASIKPPERSAGITLDKNGLRRNGIDYTLGLIYNAAPVDPIRLWASPIENFDYQLRDGFHRFYIAKTFGYSHIPAEVENWS